MIVGISGRIGSGKSTVGEFLVTRLEWSVQVNLGDEIKATVLRLFDAKPQQVYGDQASKLEPLPCGLTGREAMQELAESVRRIWPMAWIHAWSQRVDEAYAEYGLVPIIVADVRRRLEAEAILDRGGIVLRLTRNSGPRLSRPSWRCIFLGRAPVAEHITETDMDDWDGFTAVIDNAHMSEDETNTAALDECRKAGIM